MAGPPPPSSPRLPSPPPAPENQMWPKSSGAPEGGSSYENIIEKSILEANSARRIHPGTKAAEMAAGPPVVPLGQLDSPFQLQEHLKALHYRHTRPSVSHQMPINRESATAIAAAPEGIDRDLWLYELCRFLINKCNDLIVGFLFDTPPCSAQTCPEMRASEWQFLCAVHEQPKSCCAIDYCCHTLDWATATVTNPKIFPSRLSFGSGDMHAGVKHLTNIFRRLHRIFAHAWFQHREVFWRIEGETGLYVLFKTVCDTYDLLPAENYKLPPEAEGLESEPVAKQQQRHILKPDARPSSISEFPSIEDDSHQNASRTNTRRHIRSSPSTGHAVTTVLEADEEESKSMANRMKQLQIEEKEEDEEEPTLPHHRPSTPDTAASDAESEVTVMHEEDKEDEAENSGSKTTETDSQQDTFPEIIPADDKQDQEPKQDSDVESESKPEDAESSGSFANAVKEATADTDEKPATEGGMDEKKD